LASATGDRPRGRQLAEQLCTGCQIVGEQAAGVAVSADVPSFRTIANKPDPSAKRVAGRIVVPHPPMPQIQLSRQEIADLAAYIMSLKGH
jgi:mono/diheme cytochrome c family protein